ncbi:MAG: 7-carboxy-7-deazaguanine synthase QueE [Bacteroidales bacterium]|nr:7-carboxy-7-deazaguanine synthase QueE [Bacteroidales bacterium]
MSTSSTDGNMLPVMEEFYSLQGEGCYTGTAAYFIRIGGCDVGCEFCDSKAAWNAAHFAPTSIDDILHRLQQFTTRTVVLTGGEPMLYNLDMLCDRLHAAGYRTHLETSGSHPISGNWDWICLSPKQGSHVYEHFYRRAGELKVIICHDDDFVRAEEEAAKVRQVNPDCRLLLQAEWSRRQSLTPKVVNYILQHPQWTLSQQSHKYIHIR